ncbi:MAG: alkaline phosphatase family protein, partial [Terriglobales bacterium]
MAKTTPPPPVQPTVSLQASPTTITVGQSSTLTWTSSNASSVSISPSVGADPLPLNGSATVSPTQTTTYTITATGSGGQTSTSSVTITVNANTSPTVTLTAGSATIDNGSPDTLTWTTTNATAVTITPKLDIEDVDTLPLNYTAPVSPMTTTTYTITATGPGGTATASTTITVNQLPPTVTLTLNPTTILSGQSSTLRWSTGHVSALTIVDSDNNQIKVTNPASGSVTVTPTKTTTYTATATGYANQGPPPIATATATLTISPLTATLTANPESLPKPGQSATLTWNVTLDPGQTVNVSIDHGALDSSANASGSVTVTPSETTTYTLTATESNGLQTTAKATITVGTALDSNIKHIFYLVQENRSFDNYFAKLGLYRANDPFTNQSYGSVGDVDGIADDNDPRFTIHDHNGNTLQPFHQRTVCIDDLSPAWDESHVDIDLKNGVYKMDGFANGTAAVFGKSNDPAGRRVSGYYDWTDLPYYYELATQYATSDRWFAPELANTVPNRMYLFAGTSYGTTYPQVPAPGSFQQPVIFDTLVQNGISWNYYTQDGNAFLGYYNNPDNPNFSKDGLGNHYKSISQLLTALADPNADNILPSVIFIEKGASKGGMDEHPGDGNMQTGAANTASIINAFISSPVYADSIFILTWDEPGGLYDHVAPQPMAAPDDVAPSLQSPDGGKTKVIPGDFKSTGMRIPM